MSGISGLRRRVVAFAVITTLALSSPVSGEDGSLSSDLESHYRDFSVAADASLADTQGASRRIAADLGVLPAGKGGVVTITIANPYDEPIPISSLQTSCSCAKAKLLTNAIPARGNATLELLLKVPDSGKSASFDAAVNLFVDTGACKIPALRIIAIFVEYSVNGMLSFADSSLVLGVAPGQPREISLPFVHTLDSPVEDLLVEASGFLAGVSGELVPGQDYSQVKVTLDPEDATPEGVHGSITLSAGDSGPTDKIDLILFLEGTAQISPRTLRFRLSDHGLEASAVLHVRESGNPARGATEKKDSRGDRRDSPRAKSLFCEAFVHGTRLTVKQQRLSDQAYRLKLLFSGDAHEFESLVTKAGGERTVNWNIVAGSQKHTVASPFIFHNNGSARK